MGAMAMKLIVLAGLSGMVIFEIAFAVWDYRNRDRRDG